MTSFGQSVGWDLSSPPLYLRSRTTLLDGEYTGQNVRWGPFHCPILQSLTTSEHSTLTFKCKTSLIGNIYIQPFGRLAHFVSKSFYTELLTSR